MNKNYLVLSIILMVGVSGYFFYSKSYLPNSDIQNSPTSNMDTYTDTQYKFTFKSPQNSLEVSDQRSGENPKGLSFITKSIQLIEEINFPTKKYSQGSFTINLQKNVNPEKLAVSDWWNEFGFHNEKQGPEPYKQENIKVNGVNALKLYFFPRSGFGSEYYDSVIVYLARGTDLYEIWGYQLPSEYKDPDFVFTPEEIKSAQEYEKIFDQVLQSFKFID